MMNQPKPEGKQTEEVFEWAVINGVWVKITSKNANGRICLGCGCKCPCRCKDCQPFCCSSKHEGKK